MLVKYIPRMCNRRLEIRIAGSFGYPRWKKKNYIYILKEKDDITKGFTENPRWKKKKIKKDSDMTKGFYRKILS